MSNNFEKNDAYFTKKTEEFIHTPFVGFSEEVGRIRRNLLIANSVTLLYLLSGGIITSFNLFGVVVEDIRPNFINWGLFVFVLYHTIHFLFHVIVYLEQRKFKIKEEILIIQQDLKELSKRDEESFTHYKTRLNIRKKLERIPFWNWLFIETIFPFVLSLLALLCLLSPTLWKWLLEVTTL
ncbi:MAG: hypothetical protein K0U19_01725 [Proteobacteria bacterium]|nr:hypothetical protein [Pseudomonadota bacterium]